MSYRKHEFDELRRLQEEQKIGNLLDLPEPEPLKEGFNFGGDHTHYCPECKTFWTHEDAVCHKPSTIVRCAKHAS